MSKMVKFFVKNLFIFVLSGRHRKYLRETLMLQFVSSYFEPFPKSSTARRGSAKWTWGTGRNVPTAGVKSLCNNSVATL